MSDLDLARLRAVAKAARLGTWCRDFIYNALRYASKTGIDLCDDDECTAHHPDHFDADYLAAFTPETCLALLDRVAELEASLGREEGDQALAQVKVLQEALEFYADPLTYHAIAFFPDFPCGDFVGDWSASETEFGTMTKPGKRAREALTTLKEPGHE